MRALWAHWRLVLALTLIALQVAIVGVGLFAPHVSPGYRALFIDKTTVKLPYDPHTVTWPGPDIIPETAQVR